MKKLYRIEKNSWIGGVCEGIGEYTDIDPIIWRILFGVINTIIFPIFFIYVILWIILEKK